VPPPSNLNIQNGAAAARVDGLPVPLRAVREPARGGLEGAWFHRDLVDFPTLNARSKFWGDDQRAAFKNWEEIEDIRNPLTERQGINERIMLRELLRRVDMMVMYENHLDALVRLHTSLPPERSAARTRGEGDRGKCRQRISVRADAGETEVLIPAGYVTEVYERIVSP